MKKLSIIKVTDKVAFKSLENQWNELLCQSISNNLFLTWEWAHCWYRIFGKGNALLILLFKDNDDVVGIAPLFAKKYFFGKKIGFIGCNISYYLNLIAKNGYEKDVYHNFASFLKSTEKRWHVVELFPTVLKADDIEPFSNEFDNRQYKFTIEEYDICKAISLPSIYDDYLNTLSKGFRKDIGYYQRKLERNFTVEFYQVQNQEEFEENWPELMRLHIYRIRRKGRFSRNEMSNYERFHYEVGKAFMEKHKTILNFLAVNNEKLATWFAIEVGGKVYSLISGMSPDEQYKSFCLGRIIIAYNIKRAISNKCTWFDFLGGGGEYKDQWANCDVPNLKLTLERKSFGSKYIKFIEKLQKAFLDRVYWFRQIFICYRQKMKGVS